MLIVEADAFRIGTCDWVNLKQARNGSGNRKNISNDH